MTALVKNLLLWLLMALLPLQGMAAVMQASCGAEQQSAIQTSTSAHAHHAGMMHDEMASASNSADQTDHADHADQHKNGSCSACAACCVGAFAFPAATTFVPLFVKSRLEIIPPVALVTGFIPDGLERPPRPLAA